MMTEFIYIIFFDRYAGTFACVFFAPLCIYAICASVCPCVSASVRLCVRVSVHDAQRAHSACEQRRVGQRETNSLRPQMIELQSSGTSLLLDCQRAHSACEQRRVGPGRPTLASDDLSVVVWNATSGELVSTLKGRTRPVNSVAWGKGDQLALASDHSLERHFR